MIVTYAAGVIRKSFPFRLLLALALSLPLLLGLALAPASARASTGSRPLQVHAPGRSLPAFAHLRRRPIPMASYARRPLVRRFSHAWSHRLHAFAAAQPRFRAPPAFTAGGGSVIAEALRYVGAGNVTGMRGAWCADYASMVLRRTGHRALASRMVASAFSYGPRVSQPKPGDLMVLSGRRGYASHVGFFAGYQNGQILMVSGNWGHRVSVAPISRRSVAAFIGV